MKGGEHTKARRQKAYTAQTGKQSTTVGPLHRPALSAAQRSARRRRRTSSRHEADLSFSDERPDSRTAGAEFVYGRHAQCAHLIRSKLYGRMRLHQLPGGEVPGGGGEGRGDEGGYVMLCKRRSFLARSRRPCGTRENMRHSDAQCSRESSHLPPIGAKRAERAERRALPCSVRLSGRSTG
jgi:hypothetical protein